MKNIFKEKIFVIKKQLNIQSVIDKLYQSHNIPTPESKKLHKIGSKLLVKLASNQDVNEEDFQQFLQLAKKLQSFEQTANFNGEQLNLLDEQAMKDLNIKENNSNDNKNDIFEVNQENENIYTKRTKTSNI